jgi:ferredoxin-NADP reductase
LGFITDLFGLIKRNTIVFKERINEGDDIVSFVFTPEKKLKWIPGQHAGFFIGGNQTAENTMRPFNIASTPDEGVVRIATRIAKNPSDYKKYLMNLKPGDKMIMSGPKGSFYTRDINTPVLFIAGGVGIAPLRALLRNYSQKRAYAPKNVKLIYSSDSGEFVFKDELDAIKAANKFITIVFSFIFIHFPDNCQKPAITAFLHALFFSPSECPFSLISLAVDHFAIKDFSILLRPKASMTYDCRAQNIKSL